MDVRIPRRLAKGDLIGIISPSSPLDDVARIEAGVTYLEKLGYRTLIGSHVQSRLGYLAGTDRERLEDLHTMFADKRVKAVFCLRGGYGSGRLLPLVDYRLIARNPKIFLGYSDVTALALAFWRKCRLITFHGPMVGVDMAGAMDPVAEESLWRMLTTVVRSPAALPLLTGTGQALQGETARGRLLGGNLSLVVSLLGTPYQPSFSRSILFLEEIDEEPYRVDRMLTQMRNGGVFARSAGVVLGRFTNCTPKDPSRPSLSLEDIVRDLAAAERRPFSSGFSFGHEAGALTIPHGVRAYLDARAGSLQLLEGAVS
jgi:muramoyltetrapeptide carboxypeptidase